MLLWETVCVYYTIHTKHKNTLCGSIQLQVEYLLATVIETVTFKLDIRTFNSLLVKPVPKHY